MNKIIKFINKIAFPIMKFYWFIFRPTHKGIRCIVLNNHKALFIRHPYGNRSWTFPGGGIKKGESSIEAVKREVKEETGIEVNKIKKFGEMQSQAHYVKDKIKFYFSEPNNYNFKKSFEVMDIKWQSIKNPPQPLGIIAKEMIKQFNNKTS